jgi:23S rRNA (pseudouridine1915-N3)-methyltransferase
LEVIEVKDAGARGLTPSVVSEREGERLLERVTSGTGPTPRLVACDPGGDVLTSEAFAAWLCEQRDAAHHVAFVIGGAHGLSDRVRTQAHRRLSLAPWTLPHELARLVLAEQLYRAGTIARGEPYHK